MNTTCRSMVVGFGVAALLSLGAVACGAAEGDEVGVAEGAATAREANKKACSDDSDCAGSSCQLESVAACQARCSLGCEDQPHGECVGSPLCRQDCEIPERGIRRGTCKTTTAATPSACLHATQGEACSRYGISNGERCSTYSGAGSFTCEGGRLVWDGQSEYGMTRTQCLASSTDCWSDLDDHCFSTKDKPIRSKASGTCIQCVAAGGTASWKPAAAGTLCSTYARP